LPQLRWHIRRLVASVDRLRGAGPGAKRLHQASGLRRAARLQDIAIIVMAAASADARAASCWRRAANSIAQLTTTATVVNATSATTLLAAATLNECSGAVN